MVAVSSGSPEGEATANAVRSGPAGTRSAGRWIVTAAARAETLISAATPRRADASSAETSPYGRARSTATTAMVDAPSTSGRT